MTDLALASMEIHGFRVFQHLCIERLGRVNLVTGKNNVGKTCLLEALRLYARRGALPTMRDLLEARDESRHLAIQWATGVSSPSARYLFYGRHDLSQQAAPIRIGPLNAPDEMLTIAVSWFEEFVDKDGQRRLHLRKAQPGPTDTLIPGLDIRMGKKLILNYPLEIDLPDIRYVVTKRQGEGIPHVFISADGLHRKRVGQLWDSIALTDMEQTVLEALRIIAPEVERVSLVVNQEQAEERIPIVKTAGTDEPFPLRSLGEGMNRLFGIALALVNAKGGLLLIDEVESGLHYSVHPALWQLILRAAQRLNVQVFATTHSWDCIEGFQQAAQEHPEDALLISLRAKRNAPGQAAAVLFDRGELGIVTRDRIEVR